MLQSKNHVTSCAKRVHRKVKYMTFKALLKTPEDMLDKIRHLDKSTVLIL